MEPALKLDRMYTGMVRSHLEQQFHDDIFIVTAEVRPPKGTDKDILLERIRIVQDYCDAINITDNVRGIPLMSSIVCAHYVFQQGAEPIMQMTSRDRNRIMIQSDLFGAYSLGIRNVLFMKGDHPKLGTHPEATAVYDLDSIQSVSLAKQLQKGIDMVGDELEGAPDFFIGSTFNPFAEESEEIVRLKKKIDAGAEFFQTQAIFNITRFRDFMNRIDDLEIKTLAGIIPLRNPDIAEFMDQHVQGINIPSEVITRLKDAGDGLDEENRNSEYEREGLQIALELIEDVKSVKGVSGIHLMGVGWTECVPELVRKAGLFPRPSRG